MGIFIGKRETVLINRWYSVQRRERFSRKREGERVRKVKVKVKCTLVQALRLCTGRTTHRESRGIALPFLDHGTRKGEGSASLPGRSLPLRKTRYPLYRRLGGPQGQSRQVRKTSPPPGFDPRTVQPVASLYPTELPGLRVRDRHLKYVQPFVTSAVLLIRTPYKQAYFHICFTMRKQC